MCVNKSPVRPSPCAVMLERFALADMCFVYAHSALCIVFLSVPMALTTALYPYSQMGCYFAAISTVSKVYVVAIKKGGNLLVSSVGGILIFGEKAEGRILPVIGVVTGVALMTL